MRGPYLNGEWGGATIRDNDLYLHVFEWNDGMLRLPPLPRPVTDCKELGGERVAWRQDGESLTLRLTEGKTRDTHSVVKLTLTEEAKIPLMDVEAPEDAIEQT